MTRALVAVLCLAAVPALAFEGVIETKMTAKGPHAGEGEGKSSYTGTGVISIKGLNSRMEQSMNMPGVTGPMKQIIIHRADDPDTTYMVHEANRTYQKMASEKSDHDDSSPTKWTVKKLGKDTVAGRSTEHVEVQREGSGDHMELWIDKNLVSAGDLEKAFMASERGQGGWWSALRKEGLAGIPLKVVAKNSKGENSMVWEATSVKSQSVPESAFKVPAGYTESKGGFGSSMTHDQQQQMRDQMLQRLTPEQRKQMDEMMKQRGSGN